MSWRARRGTSTWRNTPTRAPREGSACSTAICEKLGFSSLGYQSLEGLMEAIGLDRDKICTYCWNGRE